MVDLFARLDPQREALWFTIMRVVNQTMADVKHSGSSRSVGYWNTEGTTCLCKLDLGMLDGSHQVHLIEAYYPWRSTSIETKVQVLTHNADRFWLEQIADRSRAVVIDGEHYRIEADHADGDTTFAGYGGQRFVLEDLTTGERTATRNLWNQGTIPPAFRDRLPDSHRFVRADDGSLDDFQGAIRDGMKTFRAGVVAELEQPAGGEHR
jgi:hypothetical protein